tara:strand:- start:1703 stop:2281 length:579 start_codon:yes stop_codon:yes gene_type:complete
LKKKLILLLKIFIFNLFFFQNVFADLDKNLIENIQNTQTLTFNFQQKINEKLETGKCFIKYPLLMRCEYKDLKQKSLISNGKTVAIIKKKYKKIYYYPIKATPLFIILQKEKILNLVKNTKPVKINLDTIEYEFSDKKFNKTKILFDKKTLKLKGWQTKDAYSNDVSFMLDNVIINNQIVDQFFKIPKEEDL